MSVPVAFLSDGDLFVLQDGGEPRQITSRFISDAENREAKSQSLNAWKSETSSWGNNMLVEPELAQFANAGAQQRKMLFTNITKDQGGNVAYSVGMPGGGGLFRYDIRNSIERRLMHRNGFFPQGLDARSSDGLLVFSVPAEDGTSSITIGERDGLQHRRLTVGDSRDEAPCWHQVEGKDYLYFHSSGVGRSPDGYVLGVGPAHICRLATDGGEVETILESSSEDFLQPRIDSKSRLHCIRRPYDAPGSQSNDPLTLLKDLLYFPYRLLRAAFFFCNFISVMFSGRPLADSKLDSPNPSRTQRLFLWGRMVDTQKAVRRSARDGETQMVPNDWQLIRKNEDGSMETIADGVLCFDLTEDDRVVYSNGGGVFVLENGKPKKIAKTKGVTQVVALSAPQG